MGTIHPLPVIPASTGPYPDPYVISLAAEAFTWAGADPSEAWYICPVPEEASALCAAMTALARVESASVALIREASRR